MALGLKEAQMRGPLPKTEVNTPSGVTSDMTSTMEENNILPYSSEVRQMFGPNNPLEGPTDPNDISGIVQSQNRLLSVLEKILVATRAIHPNTTIQIKSDTNVIAANTGALYEFVINGKKVPALALHIQNTSGTLITVVFDKNPVNTGIQIAAGATLFMTGVSIHRLGIWVTAQTQINGLDGFSTVAGNDVFLTAWGNPEYGDVWGQA